jgi:hypothetical protein
VFAYSRDFRLRAIEFWGIVSATPRAEVLLMPELRSTSCSPEMLELRRGGDQEVEVMVALSYVGSILLRSTPTIRQACCRALNTRIDLSYTAMSTTVRVPLSPFLSRESPQQVYQQVAFMIFTRLGCDN